MSQTATIRVADLIGSSFAVATDDAMRVHEVIKEKLQKGEVVTLSFEGIDMLTTSFVNPCIAYLYRTFPAEVIEKRLRFEGVFPEDKEKIDRAKERGREFYSDPALFESLLVASDH
ncbi:MAG TPA: STAS-like domain-containing protein [Trueperaceae bacterium]|jgi:hypothetical protein